MDTVHECDRQTDGRTDRITITDTVQRIASHGIKSWLIECCLLTVVSCQRIVKGPVNTAAKVSSQAFFNCSIADSSNGYVYWDYAPRKAKEGLRIYTSNEDDVDSDQQDKFGIQRDNTTGEYNLIIKNVQMDLGVDYECGLAVKGTRKTAELVALGMLRSLLSSYCQCQARTY